MVSGLSGPAGRARQAHMSENAAANLQKVRSDIEKAAKAAGREVSAVCLVAISKTFGADAIRPVLSAGQRVFGENRVQEAKAKWPELRVEYPDIELHLVGPLQTNKVKDAVELFDVIQTVDRMSLASELAKVIAKTGGRKLPRFFVQINTGEEPQKAGIAPGEADRFIHTCRVQHGLVIEGLMCIPPVDEAPAPHFALTGKIAERNGLKLLSMGMSADFESAINLGATHVRIGSAIFGERPQP
jgi:pyridoxal phosphate enzyme (YggS family)